jgi:hypothetical protein
MHYEDQDMADDLGRPSELLFKREGSGSMREHLEEEVGEDLWMKGAFTQFSKRRGGEYHSAGRLDYHRLV